jgi:hypothetical protein
MPEDPVWTYFDAQHQSILDRMKKSYQAAVAVVQRMSPVEFLGFSITDSVVQANETRTRCLLGSQGRFSHSLPHNRESALPH